MKKTLRVAALALALTTTLASAMPAHAALKEDYGKAKNVIVMIPDGSSVEAVTYARWIDEDNTLNIDDMATGLIRTNNAPTPIADSAPAGTAMATGVKSESPFVGSYPSKAGMPGSEGFDAKRAKMPIANHIEAAERQGKSTGIVSTSNVQHATPADFSAHHPNRNNYDALAEQQVFQGMEVVLGAGSKSLEAENRGDKEDLITEIKAQGYDYFTTPDAMKASTADKIWGMFDPSALANDWDRDPAKEPSLAEMTDKAIDVLSKNDKGFFLMVEGSKPDWSAHANDPMGIASEILAFDNAVGVAKKFAKEHPGTVVISATDHGTGGFTIGNDKTTKGYDRFDIDHFTKIVKNSKLTGEGAAALLNEDRSNAAEVAKQAFGIDLTAEEIEYIKNTKAADTAFGHVVSKRSGLGWTTNGHVGGDVGLYVYANGADVLSGTVHNHEIGRYIEKIMGTDLDALTDQLFIYSRDAFTAKGAEVNFNRNGGNPILEIKKDGKLYQFPTYRNYAIVDGEKVDIGGLTVFNDEKIYVPQGALDLVK
ncbi:alkaline phosphatase [Peptoniphilus ivorii]|uniref:alkaline phosphatase n=1 Tax=Aedoeadaptatus ivorii TaxID=54006 RepID=UPI0027809936|nr:alkaline phosphatase [Peptoniphilus ivorii]MDQ0508665.1 alkaline phosphatase [Peptoniphilus ivorii]